MTGINIQSFLGAFSSGPATGNAVAGVTSSSEKNISASFSASSSNSTYANSGKVYPLSLALNFIIKS